MNRDQNMKAGLPSEVETVHRNSPQKKSSTYVESYTRVKLGLMFLGGLAIVFSLIVASSALTLTGLGIFFWGLVFLFLGMGKHSRNKLLSSTTISSLQNLENILAEISFTGKGMYLPPTRLREFKSMRVLIPTKGQPKHVSLTSLETEATRSSKRKPEGIYIIPPGLALADFLEEEIGIDSMNMDLKDLLDRMPEFFIDSFDAKDVQIEMSKNLVSIKIVGSIFNELCYRTRDLHHICHLVGCPLLSSMACLLTKTTGKPVTIESSLADSNMVEACYQIKED